MSELIDRQLAIDAVCTVSCGSKWCGVSCQEVVALEELPSAADTITEKEKKEMSEDAKFQAHILSEICVYAVEHDMDPNGTVRVVANNLLAMLEICTFKNWKVGE